MNKIIIANWKLNPTSLAEAKDLFDFYIQESSKVPDVTVVICPPFVYIEELARLLRGHPVDNLVLGAQDVFWEESGAFTGEISNKQLSEFGVRYVLVGHSERRALGETDEMINKKLVSALQNGITPILLVGEKEKGEYREDILIDQLTNDLKGVFDRDITKVLITYEPVWAISSNSGGPVLRQGYGGQGNADTPESALEAIASIKNILQKMYPNQEIQSMFYGGSVNPSNIAGFLSHPEISGAVVGSASLKKEEITKMLEIVTR